LEKFLLSPRREKGVLPHLEELKKNTVTPKGRSQEESSGVNA